MTTPARRKKLSQQQEKEWAKRWGGDVVSGSGNGVLFKGDVRTDNELLELKYTESRSFSIKLDDLLKITGHALLDDRVPVYGVEFLPLHWRYVVIPENDYLAMREDIWEAYRASGAPL